MLQYFFQHSLCKYLDRTSEFSAEELHIYKLVMTIILSPKNKLNGKEDLQQQHPLLSCRVPADSQPCLPLTSAKAQRQDMSLRERGKKESAS